MNELTSIGYCGRHTLIYQPAIGCLHCRAVPQSPCPGHGRIPAGYDCPACELRATMTAEERQIQVLSMRLTVQSILLDLLLTRLARLEAGQNA